MRHHAVIFIFICGLPHIFIYQVFALSFCHWLLQSNLISNVLPLTTVKTPHANNHDEQSFNRMMNLTHP